MGSHSWTGRRDSSPIGEPIGWGVSTFDHIMDNHGGGLGSTRD